MTRAGLVVLVSVLACRPAQPEDERGDAPAQVDAAGSTSSERPGPSDEAGVLALLAPLPVTDDPESPSAALELRYRISGPDNLEGELVAQHKAGGYRSERWTMRGDAGLELSGRTIATPHVQWTAVGEQAGERRERPLAALATAYLALAPERRAAALANLRAWRAELAKSRAEQPGEGETLVGERCVTMRIAAQDLCLWEETGLLLRYEGAAFSLVVTAIDRQPTLPADAFELPAIAADAKRVDTPKLDAAALIEGLADAKVAPLVEQLAGVQLPGIPGPAASP
jgi:hypothetical protein